MATDLDILVSPKQARTKQIDLASLKQNFQKVDIQASTQCSSSCPICRREGSSGTCGLEVGHTQEHLCTRNSSHRWSENVIPGVPGPH